MHKLTILRNLSTSTSICPPTVVFILGGPCSGKGTQSQLINTHLHYKHLSAGQLLREERASPGSQHGELIQSVILSGRIVPSYITVGLLQRAMARGGGKSGGKGFLIDGFPRNMENLGKWNQIMGQKVATPFIIYLQCSQQTMLRRLQERAKTSQRSDDKLEVIKKRLKTFEEQTIPVVEWFRSSNRVLEVSSEKSVQDIFNEICHKMADHPVKSI